MPYLQRSSTSKMRGAGASTSDPGLRIWAGSGPRSTLGPLHLGYVLLERLRSQVDAEGRHEASQRDVPGDQRPVTYRGERASDQGGKAGEGGPKLMSQSRTGVTDPRAEQFREEGRLDGVVKVVGDIDDEEEG